MNKFWLVLSLFVAIGVAAAVNVRHIRSIPRSPRQSDEDDDDSQEENKKQTAAAPVPVPVPAPALAANKTVVEEKLEPVTIGSFRGFVHEVDSGDVVILDEKTLEIPDFTYDGEGPASWFVVGKGDEYTREMVDLQDYTVLPDELESCDSVRRYRGLTIRLKLPGKLTVYDISYLSLYCLRFNHNFGYVSIPDDIKVPKAKQGASKLEECEDVESTEGSSSSGSSRPSGNRPPPRRRPGPNRRPTESSNSGSLIGGLLNLLG